ncbi:hypothetical protein HHK36_021611 [Tetracentron sinense]|uniref:Uncharacterized protein n=1 Tax=Tetracentron sinense TaxID=13715 RepID=A0A834YVE6_TETSI|nr:hypothetical protein HHK36_021611 [Tetracentron sinense]
MAWEINVQGSRGFQVHQKIKESERRLLDRRWNNNFNSKNQIKTIKENLKKLQEEEKFNRDRQRDFQRELKRAWEDVEHFWETKARIDWLKAGHKNTSYFHANTIQRKQKNHIVGLEDANGAGTDNKEHVERIILDYFENIFSTTNPTNFEPITEGVISKVTPDMNKLLLQSFTDEGIKAVAFQIHPYKAPSLDVTSSSVWVNLPAAASLIILLRYLSLDFDIRMRAAAYNSKPSSASHPSQKKPLEGPKVVLEKTSWRRKVNSPVVEAAIDQFTRHLASEWVTDLWYSRVTPDRDGPEELVQIMNGVLGEVSCRVRNINLIDLLTRDIINLICTHLELFRATQAKIEKEQLENITIDYRNMKLRLVLAAENKLHPALFSAEAEHKVLQHLIDGLLSLTFKPEDLQCNFFRYTARELLACAVIRPVLNLASPRFINQRIESLVLSFTNKGDKGGTASAQEASQSKPIVSSRTSSDHFSRFPDHAATGVELVQFKNDHSRVPAGEPVKEKVNGTFLSKDPLLSIDARSSRSWSSLPFDSQNGDGKDIQQDRSGGEWGVMLDIISQRKTQALAPEHFENMWTKGKNYRKKESTNRLTKQVSASYSAGISDTLDHSEVSSKHKMKDGPAKVDFSQRNTTFSQSNDRSTEVNSCSRTDQNHSGNLLVTSYQEDDDHELMDLEEVESENSSYPTEDEESSSVTGLDSPGTKVWDSKNNRNAAVSYVHHPLESSGGHTVRKSGKGHVRYQRLPRSQSGRKRSRLSSQKVQVWQEVERTTFSSGDGQDILHTSKGDPEVEESSDDSEMEIWGRVHSGAAASSSAPSISISEARKLSVNSPENSVLADSFLKLRCEVLGANIVKSDSRTFAVYSLSVTDANNNSWSIKRRFRHFEELHRRLKEFPEYSLHLPPKHFLSTGLEVYVVQERCELLDKYLKKLLQLPTISGSIEVWDFLSVDSQTYMFSNSLSIIQTLSVDLDDKPYEKSSKVQNLVEPVNDPISLRREHFDIKSKETMSQMKHNNLVDDSRLNARTKGHSTVKKAGKECENSFEDSGSDSDCRMQKNVSSIRKSGNSSKERGSHGPQDTSELLLDATDPTLPTEWVPPNLSVPILDLVDVILQLQDGGWIRRQAFWVAKQVLQLGMGDAFDDWLIEKIQLLRTGSVIASLIKRVEQILWPDGIFITKHPKRQRPPPSVSQSQSSPCASQLTKISSAKKEDVQKLYGKDNNLLVDEQQQLEADRLAKLVYELMIDNAPAALVGLVGRKEYERCAKDLYFFLQSSVCLKQLAFDLLELLLLSAFPELDNVIKQLNEEKQKFGQFGAN